MRSWLLCLTAVAIVAVHGDWLADLRDLKEGEKLVQAPIDDDEEWHTLGDSQASQSAVPKASGEDLKTKETKAMLKIAGSASVEEFPFLTLKKLEKQVSDATLSDTTYLAEQKELCRDNIEQFKKVEDRGVGMMEQGKQVVQTSHEQRAMRRGFWKASREEERTASAEKVRLFEQRAKDYDAMLTRTADNILATDIMLEAGKIICDRLTAVRETPSCKLIYEEPIGKEDAQAPVAPPEAVRKKSEEESVKYEVTKSAEWEKQAEADKKLNGAPGANEDPDPDGFPQLMESADRRLKESVEETEQEKSKQLKKAQHGLEMLLNRAVSARVKKVETALREVLLSVKEGMMTSKRAKTVADIVVEVRKEIKQEWEDDKKGWNEAIRTYDAQQAELTATLVSQQVKQDHLTDEIDTLRNRTTSAMEQVDWSDEKTHEAAHAYEEEEKRCAGVKERFRLRSTERSEMLIKINKVHNQIALKPLDAPICDGGCTSPKNGECLAQEGGDGTCMCNRGFHGFHCESKLCPGFNGGYFPGSMSGACNGGKCNGQRGICEECPTGQYHGQNHACELKKCPSVDCNGHGECDAEKGKCKCEEGWAGEKCDQRSCRGAKPGELYPPSSHNACMGRGACDPKTGQCLCKKPYKGKGCEFAGCLNDCTGHGTCDTHRGVCKCNIPYTGPACETKRCPGGCSGNGECDRLTGRCMCKAGFTGDMCLAATACEPQIADWWTSFDKKGWSTCPVGTLLTGIYRSECNALACIEMGKCERPCEGTDPIEDENLINLCYHASWHDTMDKQGWSRCDRGYFIAGLYRAQCDSLYCLQLAKCCQIKGGNWGMCTEADWSETFKAGVKGWSSAPRDHFVTGFYRMATHALDGITKGSACTFTRDDTYKPGSQQ